MKRNEKGNPSLIDIAYRSFHLMMKANMPQDIKLCDHVIEIQQIGQIRTFEVKGLKKGVAIGYDAACKELERILESKQ